MSDFVAIIDKVLKKTLVWLLYLVAIFLVGGLLFYFIECILHECGYI